MKRWSGMPAMLTAFLCVGCVPDQPSEIEYVIVGDANEVEQVEQDLECPPVPECLPVREPLVPKAAPVECCLEPEVVCEPCETECWQKEIAYEPVYYTTQKFVEKQIPTKKQMVRMVPKQYEVQRLRYVPEVYSEIITKNEMEYYYVDDWKVRTEVVSERQCEWVPKCVWKKVTKESCDVETKQDE